MKKAAVFIASLLLMWSITACRQNGNPTTTRPTIPDEKGRNVGDDGTCR